MKFNLFLAIANSLAAGMHIGLLLKDDAGLHTALHATAIAGGILVALLFASAVLIEAKAVQS